MTSSDPFDISNACIEGKFNPNHPNISKVYANINLEKGPDHWRFRGWNPNFGEISRYTIQEWVGDGRYSDVFFGFQDDTNKCAIKMLKPVNVDRVRREMKILSVIQGHPNILNLMDIVIDPVEGIPAMVTEYISNSAWRTLFSTMDLDDCKFYLYRILQALDHTHKLGIMHRDVKPLNILCDSPRGRVVLADWGLAEFYHPMRKYSIHVATRYYKSPEILLDYEYYDYSLDIWSVGVILLEILTLKLHVFDGGDNEHQIDSIAEVIGGKPILDWAKKYRIRLGKREKEHFSSIKGVSFESLISFSRRKFRDPEALDLLKKMLEVDHKLRITAEDALNHPFFNMVKEFDNQNM